MIGKVLFVMSLITMGLLFYTIYLFIPSDSVYLVERYREPVNYRIEYGNTPVFWENLRFSDSYVYYFIDPSCSNLRKSRMVEAFDIFSDKTSVINFSSSSFSDSDIVVGCSDDYVKLGKNMFAAGEGGPESVLNTTNYKIIQKGNIMLFRESSCDYPVVELHELSHVFGFDHSINPRSIMYNVSSCDQRITDDMVRIINDLYSTPSLPDLAVREIEASKKGRYLDFRFVIYNNGLKSSDSFSLVLFADGEEFERIDVSELEIGFGRTINAENILMPDRNPDIITFFIDYDDEVFEINEDNNEITLTANQ